TSLRGRATQWPEIAEPIPAYDPSAMNDAPHPALLPAGLYDLLPPDAEIEAEATARLMGVLASHGYQRVEPPLVEFEETLLSGAGTATASGTFRLMDPISHRMVGVRADMTPQIARIAASRMSHMPRPLRLSYAGQVLRVKGSEMRPERQIGQAGAELIGAEGPPADVEAVAVAAEALQAVGVPNLKVTVDPVENRGFEYHTGISFTFFARVDPEHRPVGELGRGGRYQAGDPATPEPATGFTLYTDTILRTLPEAPRRRRVLVPLDADRAHAQALREAGWVTVAALAPAKDWRAEAGRLGCDYVIEDREPKPLAPAAKR